MANRNFTYAPGLPGYGTRGVDGSAGLTGLSYYFSEFDGVTESITIKNKIISNKILFSVDQFLPGYPERVYQTGDLFMDTNGVIWEIDLNETNRYKATTGSIATNEFFDFLKPIAATGYGRWSNNFTTDPALVDIVLRSGGAIDYTSSPANIYMSQPDQAAQWKYVNVLSEGANGYNYYPFTVFSNGGDEDAIAIVRDQSVNIWHIGNLDENGAQRSVDLQLDFNNIKLGTFAGVTSSNFYTSGDASVNGNALIGGNTSIDGNITIAGNITGDNTNLGDFNIGDRLQVDGISHFLGDVSISGSDLAIVDGNIYFGYPSGQRTTPAEIVVRNAQSTSAGNPDLKVYTEQDSSSGRIFIYTGPGSTGFAGDGGRSGDLKISTGRGGDTSLGIPGFTAGGAGNITIEAGHGGNNSGPSLASIAGNGGAIDILAGDGGIPSIGSTGSLATVGAGGPIRIRAGVSGFTTDPNYVDSSTGGILLYTGGTNGVTPTPVYDGDIVLSCAPAGGFGSRGDIKFISNNLIVDPASGGSMTGYGAFVPGLFHLINTNTISNTPALSLQSGPASLSGTNNNYVSFYDNSGSIFAHIRANNAAINFNYVSDQRLKGDIKDASFNGLDILDNIPIRDYKWRIKDSEGNPTDELKTESVRGYIAQEAMQYYPEMVSQNFTEDSSWYGVSPDSLNIVFHKAIQELSKKNKNLENKVAQLESLVSQLIAAVDPSIS